MKVEVSLEDEIMYEGTPVGSVKELEEALIAIKKFKQTYVDMKLICKDILEEVQKLDLTTDLDNYSVKISKPIIKDLKRISNFAEEINVNT